MATDLAPNHVRLVIAHWRSERERRTTVGAKRSSYTRGERQQS